MPHCCQSRCGSSRTFLFLTAFLTLVASVVNAVDTPSFDCSKAALASEKAICSNPILARMDANVSSAWRTVKSSFSTKEIKEHINREQIKWLKERDACGGNMNCLNGVYQTRLQNLEGSFEVNPFGGVWSADDVARLVIYRPVAGPYFVAIHASDPQAGAWTCDVEGRASIQHGKMILSNQGKKITITHSNRDRLNIPLSDENLDSNDYFCGLNGGFTFEYIRVHNR